MNLGISTFGCDHGKSGIGRYLSRHLAEFRNLGLEPQMFCSAADLTMIPSQFPKHLTSPRWDRPLANLLLHQTWLPAQTRKLDVLFLPAANRRIPWTSACPTVGTVHDLAVAKLKGKYDPARTFYISKVLPKLVKRLDHILTVSQASKRDIVDVTGVDPDKISVTPLGVDHTRYYPQAPEVDFKAMGIDKPFLLYVSRIEHPGKNHQQLLRAFDHLKSSLGIPHQLVLVGSDWKGSEKVHALAQSLSCKDDIIFTGFFPEEHLPQLYNQAEALVFPSLYEGFGLPVLEAMACGLPVVCSDRASLPEVVGEAGLLFDPSEDGDLETQLTRLLTCMSTRLELAAKGRQRSLEFRWELTAAHTLQVLTDVSAGRRPNPQQKGAVLCA